MGIISERGEDVYRLTEELKIQERKIIDFSTSVNPLGVSKKVKAEIRKHLKYLHNYPDSEAIRLKKRLAQYHGIDPEMILCGNGSTELIYLIARTLKPKKVLIPAPTFSEYERATIRAQSMEHGAQIKYFVLKKENNWSINPDEFITFMKDCNMAFLCNPNNPTGLLLGKDSVLKIAEAVRDLKCYLIVDEAFIDFCQGTVPDLPPSQRQGVESGLSLFSVIKEVENNPYLIVLRSMSLFYSLPGLRLGYGVFPQHLIDRLKENKEPWTVNSLAQRAAVVALKDRVYREGTFRLMKEEKRFLEKSFKKIGIEFFHTDANFYLIKINNAYEICQHLKKKGILVRDCSNFKGLDNTYIRVAVKSHRENTILTKELSKIFNNSE
ncbi:MAG: aminotransferase class I/II-fold pyridoxal phosphate-dependent enzyme [Nitrospirota bacterium]|nr:aminotransferase class I/II-fold pyridoxal phosphate-dependent enzyme [Nitrospirota bacterium]